MHPLAVVYRRTQAPSRARGAALRWRHPCTNVVRQYTQYGLGALTIHAMDALHAVPLNTQEQRDTNRTGQVGIEPPWMAWSVITPLGGGR